MYFLLFQDFLNTIMLVLSKKGIIYNKAFKYLRYKKVFLDENPKIKFSDMKKLQKAAIFFKCSFKKKS